MEVADDEIVLTREGHQKLQDEISHLTTVERPEVNARLRETRQSAEDFDTSEYENAKMDQALVEGRIHELKQILLRSSILDETDIPTSHVGLGSKVRLKKADGRESWEVRIVSPVEADPFSNKISTESPLGSALLGHKPRETVEVRAPAGIARYKILKISK